MTWPESRIDASLRELLALAGMDETLATQVEFSGSDPVFRTPYRIGTAGAAALGAVGLAVSDLWRLRKGRGQGVAVDAGAAAASLRSARYLRIDGQTPADPWDPLSGFYPARGDRWVSVHCNFPNHRDAAMKVLGTPAERAAAEEASRSWDGLALEDAIHAAGGCAGLARSAAEWAGHPHAAAVVEQPLIEIRRIGDAPPGALPPGNRPLAGVRVLDLTRVLAGPTCARTLAEHGADVLKITAAHLPDSGPMEIDTGIGKLSAHVDLRSPAGVETLCGLLREADVFSQSYRPGTLAARGFSPEQAAAMRPGIVYVTLSAWGPAGPKRIADLKARAVALNARGVVVEWVLDQVLRRDGLTIKDVQVKIMPFPDMVPALESGAVDACILSEPFPTMAEEKGVGVRPLARPAGAKAVPFTAAFWNAEWARANADLAHRVMLGYVRAVRDLAAYGGRGWTEDRSVEIMVKYAAVRRELVKKARSHVVDPNLELDASVLDDLRRRVDAAAKLVPLARLALSPQCGFASTAPGNPLTPAEQRRKLELVVDVARRVWG